MTTLTNVNLEGLYSAMPAAGNAGRLYFATDTNAIYKDTGSAWILVVSAGGMANPMTTMGDIIYGGASGAPQRLAAGTAGQVLQTNGSSGPPGWVAASGGGGGGGLFAANLGTIPTLSSLALTTALNHSSSFSAANVSNGVYLVDPTAQSGNFVEGNLGTYPTAPFTVTALISCPVFGQNYSYLGLVCAASATGALLTCGVGFNSTAGGWVIETEDYSSPTGYVATHAGFAANSETPPPFLWLRIKDDATNITFSASYDGNFFQSFYTSAKSATYLGANGGFNFLGIFVEPQNVGVGMTIMSWGITNP